MIKLGKADENKVVVFGGSHGGFISLHLVGQYPVSVDCCCIIINGLFYSRIFTKQLVLAIQLWIWPVRFSHFDNMLCVYCPIGMFTTSDIPDWYVCIRIVIHFNTHTHTHTHRCCIEAGVPYDLAAVPSSSSFGSMLNKSPIIYADKVSTSTVYSRVYNIRSFRLRLQY